MHQRKKDAIRTAVELTQEAVVKRIRHLEMIQQRLTSIDGQSCTGREYWRDQNHPTRSPKLYVIHSIDDDCPLHGSPEPGKRLRTYVGTDTDAIREARRAIGLNDWREELVRRKRMLETGLSSCDYLMTRMLRALQYQVDSDRLISDWQPEAKCRGIGD